MEQRPKTTVMTAVVLTAAMVLGACSTAERAQQVEVPIVLEEIAGTALSRLTLSASAAKRLDIQTASVEVAGDGLVVTSDAVIIDPQGVYWVYTNPEPLVFVRQEIRPVREEALQAFFGVGPAAGTLVAIVGVPELYGAEFGIGK